MQCFQSAYLGGSAEIFLRDEAFKKKIVDTIAFK